MRKKGFTLIELLVVIAIIAMLLAILMPALSKVKKIAQRVVCGTNLKGLGTAQTVYAHDYDGRWTVQGGRTRPNLGNTFSLWDDPQNNVRWNDPALTGFTISVGTSLYLLVREADVSPKSFICPAGGQTEFDGKNQLNRDLVQLWDFGADPSSHISYSYHQPYVAGDTSRSGRTSGQSHPFAADGQRSASFAVMADRNPFFDPRLTLAAPGNFGQTDYMDKASFLNGNQNPAGTPPNWDNIQRYLIHVANSQPHDREGQNVLYADGHTSYETRSDVGTRNDNIFTPWNIDPGQALGTEERLWRIGGSVGTASAAFGKGTDDSILVNDGRW